MTMLTPAKHNWAVTGVSGYPLSHPIVGQARFARTFTHFLHLLEQDSEGFAQVFAVIGPWGIGKSRLGYEVIAQTNDTSRGWFVRDEQGQLTGVHVFHDGADREQYLGLYIRYSQIANEYHNADNWFGFGVYKALLPLTSGHFDSSIQGSIAKESYDRLLVLGFDHRELAKTMEVDAHHTDEELYEDPHLVTRLCRAAYAYLAQFGIKYIMVVLDELETVAEAATYGLEQEDIKRLDGRAIKLMGKAIKEEDPRRKLPWLRYVTLCSPAIGDELREIQSVARRFEMVELSQNAFSDVSDFIKRLKADGRLSNAYPEGLVEAAYAMSGGNFGWFNVIMANADQVLNNRRVRSQHTAPTLGELFDEAVQVSSRMSEHVLDHHALEELHLDRQQRDAARELLYGQLPVPLVHWGSVQQDALLRATNEFDEPIATRYARQEWDDQGCSRALQDAKFMRNQSVWELRGVDQPLDLRQLLANLETYAIHETHGIAAQPGRHLVLIPLHQREFIDLITMLYPHPAAGDAARALWRRLISGDDLLPEDQATHIGPSVAMLGRLNLRCKRQSQNTLVFRDPDANAAHEQAMTASKTQGANEKAVQILTGAMRGLDENWGYDPELLINDPELVAVVTTAGRNGRGGLVTLDALRLHPDGRLVLGYVRKVEDLELLAEKVSERFAQTGRTPVIAFTTSRALVDKVTTGATTKLKEMQSFVMLYQLTASEEYLLQQVGLRKNAWRGYELHSSHFTTAYAGRLQTLVRALKEEIAHWRYRLDALGRIAWPFRSSGTLSDDDAALLFRAWRWLMIEGGTPRTFSQVDEHSGFKLEEVLAVLERTGLTPRARAAGYAEHERAGLFSRTDQSAEPQFPAFLVYLINELLSGREWTIARAEKEWFWGYTWDGAKPKDIFVRWMELLCVLGFAQREAAQQRGQHDKYLLINRTALSGAHREAHNWLTQAFPIIVQRMEEVFGEGRVRDLFAPPNSVRVGTKTNTAVSKLADAEQWIQQLVSCEANRDTMQPLKVQATSLITCARLRVDANRAITGVFDKDAYEKLTYDDNVRTLSFEDDSSPLWQRIRRAELYAEFALRTKELIEGRIDPLADEMRQGVDGIVGFPIQLFTRSLERIRNILDGAIGVYSPQGTTQRLQHSQDGTLGHYLADLNIAKATEKFTELATEVGLDLGTGQCCAFADISGRIVDGYRRLRESFTVLHERLSTRQEQVTKLRGWIAGPPADFQYPVSTPSLDEIARRLDDVRDEIVVSINDDIEELIRLHERATQLGNFRPLMQAAEELTRSAKETVGLQAGYLDTIHNVVSDYLSRLLESRELLSSERGVNTLLRASALSPLPELSRAELEATGNLTAARGRWNARCQQYHARGTELLDGTPVSFDLWIRTVAALDAQQEPQLDREQENALVNRGYLRRILRIGGGAHG